MSKELASIPPILGLILFLVIAGPQLFEVKEKIDEGVDKSMDGLKQAMPNQESRELLDNTQNTVNLIEDAKEVKDTALDLRALLLVGAPLSGIVAFILKKMDIF